MTKLITLLLLLVGVAQAQGLTTKAPGQAGQKRTNYAFQSNGMSSGAAMVAPWAAYLTGASTVNDGLVPGGGTWARITGSAANSVVYQTVTTPNASVFHVSAYLRSGTGLGGLKVACTGGVVVSACTCTRSDGAACTATFPGSGGETQCEARMSDLTTAITRVEAHLTCASDRTSVSIQPMASDGATATTVDVAGAQVEVGVTKASKLCVTTTAAKTCK